jgi:TolA-binding protein
MENDEKERAINELREKVAGMSVKIEILEDRTAKIMEVQEETRDKQEQAALREKDLSKLISDLNGSIQDHLKLHEDMSKGKWNAFQIVMGILMLGVGIISAYGAIATVALTKAMQHTGG